MIDVFSDRVEAGCLLAEADLALELVDPVVLALPRGGVPVAARSPAHCTPRSTSCSCARSARPPTASWRSLRWRKDRRSTS